MLKKMIRWTLALMLAASPVMAQGGLRVQGTTNLTPLLAKAAASYTASNAGASIAVKGTSSGAGIAALRTASIDVAASDVAIDDPSFSGTSLGRVGFAFVANAADGISNLTRAQVQAIFSGRITNWKALGGADLPIVIISRDIGTGTRLVLEERVAKTLIPTRVVQNADQVMDAVAGTRGAIGYVASYFVGSRTSMVVTYEGVAPSPQAIRSKTYAFSTEEHLYVRKDASAAARAFVAYVANNTPLLRSFGIY
jgi:phosphate transport system substrate-binding protein